MRGSFPGNYPFLLQKIPVCHLIQTTFNCFGLFNKQNPADTTTETTFVRREPGLGKRLFQILICTMARRRHNIWYTMSFWMGGGVLLQLAFILPVYALLSLIAGAILLLAAMISFWLNFKE